MRRTPLLAFCLLLHACGGSPAAPSHPSGPPSTTAPVLSLRLQGEVTVTAENGNLTGAEVRLDDEFAGDRGGSEPWGSWSLTVLVGHPLFGGVKAIRPGSHELELRFSQRAGPSRFTTEATSFVNVINTENGVVVGTATLRPQALMLQEPTASLRWTIDVDAAGRVQVR
jgi:hypothetical protein